MYIHVHVAIDIVTVYDLPQDHSLQQTSTSLSGNISHTISDAKWHTSELIQVVLSFEGCVRYVFTLKWHLMINSLEINGAKNLVLGNLIYHIINLHQRKSIKGE